MKAYVVVNDVLDDLPPIDADTVENDTPVSNHITSNYTQKTVKRIGETECGEQLYDSWNGMVKLTPDEPCRTMDAAGTGRYQFAHYEEDRPLSLRERARLMSFPDTFVFEGEINEIRSQQGNAVPPKLAASIADELS